MYAHQPCFAAPLRSIPPCCAAKMQPAGGLVVSEERSLDASENKKIHRGCVCRTNPRAVLTKAHLPRNFNVANARGRLGCTHNNELDGQKRAPDRPRPGARCAWPTGPPGARSRPRVPAKEIPSHLLAESKSVSLDVSPDAPPTGRGYLNRLLVQQDRMHGGSPRILQCQQQASSCQWVCKPSCRVLVEACEEDHWPQRLEQSSLGAVVTLAPVSSLKPKSKIKRLHRRMISLDRARCQHSPAFSATRL